MTRKSFFGDTTERRTRRDIIGFHASLLTLVKFIGRVAAEEDQANLKIPDENSVEERIHE